MSFWTGISQLRTILSTETDYDSPNSEELMEQIRENIETLFMLLFDTAASGAADSDPPDDTTGVLTDAAPGFVADVHNGRTLLITSGLAIGNLYTIDDTTASTIVCTGDNLYDDGVRQTDTYKVLYDVKANADGHDHDGVNSKSAVLADDVITQAKMANSAVGQAELKTTTYADQEDVLPSTDHTFSLTGGMYIFTPQWRAETTDITRETGQTVGAAYETTLKVTNNNAGANRTAYVYCRYVQASGEVYWIFIKRNKSTKKITSISACADHPCFGCGGKPLLKPHPFYTFDPDTEELIVINPTKEEVKAMAEATAVEDENLPDRCITDVIREDYEIDELSTPAWPKEKVTVALPPDWHEAWLEGRKVTPVKKVIPQPEGMAVRKLKRKV